MNDDDRGRLTAGIRWAVSTMTGSKVSKAARLSVSLTTLEKWIAGANLPTEKNLARLARVAGTDQETLRNGGPLSVLETEAS